MIKHSLKKNFFSLSLLFLLCSTITALIAKKSAPFCKRKVSTFTSTTTRESPNVPQVIMGRQCMSAAKRTSGGTRKQVRVLSLNWHVFPAPASSIASLTLPHTSTLTLSKKKKEPVLPRCQPTIIGSCKVKMPRPNSININNHVTRSQAPPPFQLMPISMNFCQCRVFLSFKNVTTIKACQMTSFHDTVERDVLLANIRSIPRYYQKSTQSSKYSRTTILAKKAQRSNYCRFVNECGVLNAIVALISYLYDCDMKPLSEAHLTPSCIHPFVHGLLSAKTPASVAHCSNVVADEIRNTNNSPADVYASGNRYSYTNAYGEVKPNNQVSPTLLVNDFYRLAIDPLDKFKLNQVLAFQAIGNCVTFFAMYLSFPQLYTFTELVRLNIPTKTSDLVNLIGHLSNLTFLSSVHKNYCLLSRTDCSV